MSSYGQLLLSCFYFVFTIVIPVFMQVASGNDGYGAIFPAIVHFAITLFVSYEYLLLVTIVEIICLSWICYNNILKSEEDIVIFATRVGLSRNDGLIADAYNYLTPLCRDGIQDHSDLVREVNTAILTIEKRRQRKINKSLYV